MLSAALHKRSPASWPFSAAVRLPPSRSRSGNSQWYARQFRLVHISLWPKARKRHASRAFASFLPGIGSGSPNRQRPLAAIAWASPQTFSRLIARDRSLATHSMRAPSSSRGSSSSDGHPPSCTRAMSQSDSGRWSPRAREPKRITETGAGWRCAQRVTRSRNSPGMLAVCVAVGIVPGLQYLDQA